MVHRHIRQADQIRNPARPLLVDGRADRGDQPEHAESPAFRWAKDAEVSAAIHAAAPVLIRKLNGGITENPWQAAFRRLFDMANDSALFMDHADVASRIVARQGRLAVLDDGSEIYPYTKERCFGTSTIATVLTRGRRRGRQTRACCRTSMTSPRRSCLPHTTPLLGGGGSGPSGAGR